MSPGKKSKSIFPFLHYEIYEQHIPCVSQSLRVRRGNLFIYFYNAFFVTYFSRVFPLNYVHREFNVNAYQVFHDDRSQGRIFTHYRNETRDLSKYEGDVKTSASMRSEMPFPLYPVSAGTYSVAHN